MKRKLVSLGTKELKKIRGGKNDANACDDTVDGGTLDEKLQTVNKYSFFDFTLNKPNNILWNQFDQCLKDYSRLKFSYKIIQKQHSIVYKEYSKRRLIKCIEIEDRLTLIILDALNCNVYDTLDELMQTINTQGNQLSLSEVKESLKELFNEGIVFYTDSYENITSIINYK